MHCYQACQNVSIDVNNWRKCPRHFSSSLKYAQGNIFEKKVELKYSSCQTLQLSNIPAFQIQEALKNSSKCFIHFTVTWAKRTSQRMF